jgi:hypothetical protein
MYRSCVDAASVDRAGQVAADAADQAEGRAARANARPCNLSSFGNTAEFVKNVTTADVPPAASAAGGHVVFLNVPVGNALSRRAGIPLPRAWLAAEWRILALVMHMRCPGLDTTGASPRLCPSYHECLIFDRVQ